MTIEKVFKEKDRIIIQHKMENGRPPRLDEYFTMRCGITWPTPKWPGFYCIFGLKDEPSLGDKRPLKLLAEGEASLPEKLYSKIIQSVNLLKVERILADLSEENEVYEAGFLRYARDNKAKGPRPQDSSEFDDVDHGILLVRQHIKDELLEIKEGTILRGQLKSMTVDDIKDGKFYAVMAFIRVLASFEAWPWHRGTGGPTGFSNWLGR